MRDEDDDQQSPTGRNWGSVTQNKSFARFQGQRYRVCEGKSDLCKTFQETQSSTPGSSTRHLSKLRQEGEERRKPPTKPPRTKEGKVFSNPEFVVSDCWKTPSAEVPLKLIELFKEKDGEDEDPDVSFCRRRPAPEDEEKLSHTKEFHVLTEVQKARILVTIEDAIKKLANSDLKDFVQEARTRGPDSSSFVSDTRNVEKYFCRKFLLPWIFMKVIEMILCHIIQVAFLSNDSYFERKSDFLPVVVAFYLTLFIVIFSMIVHVSCYAYLGARNPCYFMCVVSLSIVTLTTALGILVILCSMEFYRTFREIFVLVLIGVLLCSLVAELSVCYIEVKNFWNSARHADERYVP